jgi:hypothetical protein
MGIPGPRHDPEEVFAHDTDGILRGFLLRLRLARVRVRSVLILRTLGLGFDLYLHLSDASGMAVL